MHVIKNIAMHRYCNSICMHNYVGSNLIRTCNTHMNVRIRIYVVTYILQLCMYVMYAAKAIEFQIIRMHKKLIIS